MDEFKLLKKLKSLTQDRSVILGPGDDSAVIEINRKKILFCGDMLIEGVHFVQSGTRFEDLGYKAAARTLSDIAAMAGVPKYIGVSLSLPKKHTGKIKDILKGIEKLTHRFKINLVGGDTSVSDKIFIDVWCIGEISGRYISRRGARSQDGIFVSGKLGCSYETGKHLSFIPRIKESLYLKKHFKINSMIDISDSLTLDLYRLIKESSKSAVIFEDKIPLTLGAGLKNALYDGEDYELLFTAPLKHKDKIEKAGFWLIGLIKEGKSNIITLKRASGKSARLKPKGHMPL